MINDNLIIVRGSGDLATGVAWYLFNAGFKVICVDIERPSTIRRTVAFSEAIYDGKATVDGTTAVKCNNINDIYVAFSNGYLPVIIDENLKCLEDLKPKAVVDSIIAKKNLGTTIDMADIVVGVGPGFTAGVDCHYAIETSRGHDLARIITNGSPLPNTGVPGDIKNHTKDRVLHAEVEGTIRGVKKISDTVHAGDIIAYIDDTPVLATIDGILRGLISDGFHVTVGFKIADIDPRINEKKNCFTISDKARNIGGAVLLSIMMGLKE